MNVYVLAVIALVGPLLAYLGAARKLSGKIATSEASDLWEESRAIRQDYQRRIEALTSSLEVCETRIDQLEERNQALYLENGNLKRMIEGHEATIKELREEMHQLRDENTLLKKENAALRKRVDELESNGG